MLYVVCACEECLDSRGAGTGVAPPPRILPLSTPRGSLLGWRGVKFYPSRRKFIIYRHEFYTPANFSLVFTARSVAECGIAKPSCTGVARILC